MIYEGQRFQPQQLPRMLHEKIRAGNLSLNTRMHAYTHCFNCGSNGTLCLATGISSLWDTSNNSPSVCQPTFLKKRRRLFHGWRYCTALQKTPMAPRSKQLGPHLDKSRYKSQTFFTVTVGYPLPMVNPYANTLYGYVVFSFRYSLATLIQSD